MSLVIPDEAMNYGNLPDEAWVRKSSVLRPRHVRRLFHRDAYGLPPGRWGFPGNLHYSNHAEAEANTDRYGSFIRPQTIKPDAEVLEIGLDDDDSWVHVLYRQYLDHQRDISLAVDPRTGDVKTCWVNRADDTHSTLDKSRYDQP